MLSSKVSAVSILKRGVGLRFSQKVVWNLISGTVPNHEPTCSNQDNTRCSGVLFTSAFFPQFERLPLMAIFCQSCHDRLHRDGQKLHIKSGTPAFRVPRDLCTIRSDSQAVVFKDQGEATPISWHDFAIDCTFKSSTLQTIVLKSMIILDSFGRVSNPFSTRELTFVSAKFLKKHYKSVN